MKVYTVFAFTHGNLGGNAAGVCLLDDGIDAREMLRIAAEVGYSETAFVRRLSESRFHIDYFTPTEQVELCGHATIASFFFLKESVGLCDGNYRLSTRSYDLTVTIEGDIIHMEQPKAIFGRGVPSDEIALSLGISESELLENPKIRAVSTGIMDLMVGVDSRDTLKRIIPDFDRIRKISERYEVGGYHVYALTEGDYTAYVRNFAPILGIDEESATGTSNCALSALLRENGRVEDVFRFHQGMWMNAPSDIITKYDSDKDSYWVGGSGKIDQALTFKF